MSSKKPSKTHPSRRRDPDVASISDALSAAWPPSLLAGRKTSSMSCRAPVTQKTETVNGTAVVEDGLKFRFTIWILVCTSKTHDESDLGWMTVTQTAGSLLVTLTATERTTLSDCVMADKILIKALFYFFFYSFS